MKCKQYNNFERVCISNYLFHKTGKRWSDDSCPKKTPIMEENRGWTVEVWGYGNEWDKWKNVRRLHFSNGKVALQKKGPSWRKGRNGQVLIEETVGCTAVKQTTKNVGKLYDRKINVRFDEGKLRVKHRPAKESVFYISFLHILLKMQKGYYATNSPFRMTR